MAFNTQEQEIIQWGLQNGKSKDEVKQAISNYRLGITPKAKPVEVAKPSTFERIKTGIQEKGAKVQEQIAGEGEFANKSALERGVGATATAFSALSGTLYNALPEGARNTLDTIGGGIGKGVEYLADEISKNPAVQKFAMSEAGKDTEKVAKVLSDLGIISGEILGADQATKVLNKGGNIVSKGIDKTKSTVKDVIGNTDEISKYPAQIADTISEKITKIDPKVKNILETSSVEKFDRYVKVGEEALTDPRKLTPLEQAGELVDNQILPAMKEDLGRIGSQKAKTLQSIKNVQVKDATKEVVDFVKEKVKTSKLTPDESKLINNILSELELGKSPTISTLDKTVDLLQSTLYERAKGLSIPVTSRVQGIVNQAIGKLNNVVKTAAKKSLGSGEYSVLNDAYATRIKLFNKLNKAIGEEGTKGGSLFKKFFSPQDAGTKQLFAEIKDIYGIDLAQDATLAKFVMESLGDTRASSLLEQIPTSKTGAVMKGLETLERKLTKPIPKARKIIQKRESKLKQ